MARFDQSSGARCFVFTYKEGLLSRIAHDLKIEAQRFSADLEDDAITATVDASSLRVVNAMKDGREDASLLSASDKSKIEATIVDDVLHARRHRDIRFASTSLEGDGERRTIRGDLTLHGATRPLRIDARVDGDMWVARVRLHQPDWGIKPYRAALGALKLKPDVDVEIRLPRG